MKYEIYENIYGHKKRLDFIKSNILPSDKVLEFGCGTGAMITIPLAIEGYNIRGIDRDGPSISYGKKVIKECSLNIDPDIVEQIDLAKDRDSYDVIIASEVLEHIYDTDGILELIYTKLKAGGRLIITIPNSYGWFEMENFIWNRLKIGHLLMNTGIYRAVSFLGRTLWRRGNLNCYLSSLSNSPHVKRFTLKSICTALEKHHFSVKIVIGSTLIAGLFSNLLFTGNYSVMGLNNKLGSKFLKYASSFYIVAQKI